MPERRDDPLVSVVLCTRDAGAFLAPQIETLREQTHRRLEVIAIDDGSRDGTRDRLTAWAATDPRVRLFAHDTSAGLVPRLEEGLARVRGRFVVPADQDDVWERDKVETLLGALGECDAVYSASALIDATGRPLGGTLLESLGALEPQHGRDPWALFWNNTVSGHATLFRAALLERLLPFDRRLMYDHQIGIVAAAHGGLAYCPRPLVHHRVHAGNQVTRLSDAAVQRRDPERRDERRIARRRKTRTTLASHGAYFAERIPDPGFTPRDAARLARAQEIFTGRRFDLGLFLELVWQRKRLLGRSSGRLRWAWTTARGERWYAGAAPRSHAAAVPAKEA